MQQRSYASERSLPVPNLVRAETCVDGILLEGRHRATAEELGTGS